MNNAIHIGQGQLMRQRTYGKGYSAADATEDYIVASDGRCLLNGSEPGCIVGHGALTKVDQMVNGDESQWIQPIIDQKIPIICTANGGDGKWGNNTSQARFAETWANLTAYGASTTRRFAVGTSMGGIMLLNGIFNRGGSGTDYSSLIAGIVLICPVLDLQYIVDNNPSSLGSGQSYSVTSAGAYNGTPNYSTYSPYVWGVGNSTLQNIPILMYYSTNDPICNPSASTAFAAAMNNITLVSLGANGHSQVGMPDNAAADFFKGLL